MKVSILAKSICPATESLIDFLADKGLQTDCVIIERNSRKRFSDNEKAYRDAHTRFNNVTNYYSRFKRIKKAFWNSRVISGIMYKHVYYIPVINRFSLRRFCNRRDIPVFEVRKHSSVNTRDIITKRGIEYTLLLSSNWLLKPPLLDNGDIKIINGHSGKLPNHRGLDSMPWSVKNSDEVGLTTHFINEKIDGGDILKFYEIKPKKGMGLNDIHREILNIRNYAFYDTLMGLSSGEILPKPQTELYPLHKSMSFNQLIEINSALISEQ